MPPAPIIEVHLAPPVHDLLKLAPQCGAAAGCQPADRQLALGEQPITASKTAPATPSPSPPPPQHQPQHQQSQHQQSQQPPQHQQQQPPANGVCQCGAKEASAASSISGASSTASNGAPSKRSSGGGLLKRAKSSAINLATLAHITDKFHYSASVGNLWPLQQLANVTGHGQRRELAELSGDSAAVKPLEFIAGAFDDDPPASHQSSNSNLNHPQLLSNNNNDSNNNNSDRNNNNHAMSHRPDQRQPLNDFHDFHHGGHHDYLYHSHDYHYANGAHKTSLDQLNSVSSKVASCAICSPAHNADAKSSLSSTSSNGRSKSRENTNSKSLLNVASVSRKNSAKEKLRRQKEAEEVEKLRMLVDYLRNGSTLKLARPCDPIDSTNSNHNNNNTNINHVVGQQQMNGSSSMNKIASASNIHANGLGPNSNSCSCHAIVSSAYSTGDNNSCANSTSGNADDVVSTNDHEHENQDLKLPTMDDDRRRSSCRLNMTSAWTNPQNLATWIDNEVNSLVSDLEAQSHLVEHHKSGKRKWLSSSNSSRRNSSGAHST